MAGCDVRNFITWRTSCWGARRLWPARTVFIGLWTSTHRFAPRSGRRHVQLTEVEAAFHVLKSEVAIRPIWHRTQRRVEAHILVAFLGYCLPWLFR